MKTRRDPTIPTLILLLLAGGCSQNPPPDQAFLRRAPEERSVRIHVTNLNFMDATLWAITSGSRKKLGVVTGKLKDVFTLPWEYPQDLKIDIDLLAGPRCTTRGVTVHPGDDIELIIDVDMTHSSLCGGGMER